MFNDTLNDFMNGMIEVLRDINDNLADINFWLTNKTHTDNEKEDEDAT